MSNCKAITSNKKTCSRMGKYDGYCHQHKALLLSSVNQSQTKSFDIFNLNENAIIGDWSIISTLSKKTRGTVYKAINTITKDINVIKVDILTASSRSEKMFY